MVKIDFFVLFLLELKTAMSAGVHDPLVDVTGFEDTSLGEGYGTDNSTQTQNIVHQSMIKRLVLIYCCYCVIVSQTLEFKPVVRRSINIL